MPARQLVRSNLSIRGACTDWTVYGDNNRPNRLTPGRLRSAYRATRFGRLSSPSRTSTIAVHKRRSGKECSLWRIQPRAGAGPIRVRYFNAYAWSARVPLDPLLASLSYFALSRFANSRYAPGTPAGSWRNHEYAVKM